MIPIKGVIAITVKMAVAQAQAALQNLRTQVVGMQKSLNSVNAASNAMAAAQGSASKATSTLGQRLTIAGKNAMKSASQFQWYSRQLMYNVGLPLLIVGAYAGKWALETEAAMVKVSKVYGDLRMDPTEKKQELDALAGYFEAVSNRYGMLQKDVIAIGADWAAAGAQALGLAKATKLTVETMILGEMSAEEATSSLIAIQEAWRLSAKDLQKTLGDLNLVENQTAVTMQGLIAAFVRTGSAARVAGLTTGDLAALIAGLVPAAGNATVAGNSLKTILSRLAAPTTAAKRAFKEMGINIESTSWQSMSARDQLEKLSQAFERNSKTGELRNKAAKQMIATDIAGRQQYNRFIQLMDALSDKTSAYWTAQEALRTGKEKINGETRRQIQYEQELNQVLQSNPQQIKIVLAQLQNMAIKGVAPLIPYFIAFLGYMKQVFQFLGNMPPEVKNVIAALVLFSLAISLLSKLASPFVLLFGMLARLVPLIIEVGGVVITALANPWILAIAAIIAAVVILINFFPETWNNIVGAVVNIWNSFITYMSDTTNVFGKIVAAIINLWYALPASVRKAIQAVVDIVYQGAMAVYSLFSYLNPFAHHSPSLVENVTEGMAVIMQAFSEIVDIETPINKAYADIKKFKDLMASFRNGKAVDLEFADKLKAIKAVNPAALASAKAMIADIKALQKILDKLGEEMAAQQKIVDAWKSKLDDANAALDEQQVILDSLTDTVGYYQGLIDDANNTINDFANTSITGMQALADETEANTEAQNQLKLAMAQMEQQGTAGFDSLADRMAALNGEFENLTANRDELVKAGAGSDVLQYYDQQIAAIQEQKNSIEDTADAYTKMSQQLSDLQKQGDILDLQKSVNYDPLTYQINKLANAQEEMDYDDIVKGIENAQQAVKDYTPELKDATAAMKEQEAVVYSLKSARDEIQKQYDIENAKLQKIKDKYDAVKDAIGALKDALNEMSNAAGSANKKLSKGALGAGSGSGSGSGSGFGYPGGAGKLGKKSVGIRGMEKGTAEDIKKAMENLQKIADGLDFTKPIREAWEGAVKWWMDNIQPALDDIGRGIGDWWNGFYPQLESFFKPIGEFLNNLFGDDFQVAWSQFVQGINDFITQAAPGFQEFWDKAWPAIQKVGEFLWNVILVIGAVVGTVLKAVLWLWNNGIQPLLRGLGSVLGWLFKTLGYVIDLIGAAFSMFDNPGEHFEKMKNAILGIVGSLFMAVLEAIRWVVVTVLQLIGGLFSEIWQTFSNFFPDLAKGISDWFGSLLNIPWIKDFVDTTIALFTDLWNVLIGHSIIPDIVNGIVGWFSNMAGWAIKPISDTVNNIAGAFSWAWDQVKNTDFGKAVSGAVSGVQNAASGVWSWITSPFTKSETTVQTSMDNIQTTASTGVTDIDGVFNSSTWQGMSSDISNPFETGSTTANDSFDDIFKGFKGLGKDLDKTTRTTDWTKFNKSMKKYWDKLPKDQKVSTKKIVESFEAMGAQIQKTNPKLWDKIVKTITKSTSGAAGDVAFDTKSMKNSITGLGNVQIPTNWQNLGSTISAPTGRAAKDVKADVKAMNKAIDGLDGGIPKEWKNLRNTIVDPVKDAQAELKKVKLSVGGITGSINKIASAADKAASRVQKLIDKLTALSKKTANGMAAGGAVGMIGKMATGGSVIGAGGPRDDKILTWLSNGEHVMTAREVDRLGGQASVYLLRRFIRDNNVNAVDLINAYRSSVPRKADGGAIVALASSTSAALRASTKRSQSASVSRAPVESRTTNIEHAHFEFPNIKNPNDAKEFLDNLEALL